MAKGRGEGLISSPCLTHGHQEICVPAEEVIQLEMSSDLRDVMKQPRTVTFIPSRQDRNNFPFLIDTSPLRKHTSILPFPFTQETSASHTISVFK